jgi:hypothetical protein
VVGAGGATEVVVVLVTGRTVGPSPGPGVDVGLEDVGVSAIELELMVGSAGDVEVFRPDRS